MGPTLLTTLSMGFLLGLVHALEADHVIAVSTFVSQHRTLRRASTAGVFWGLGHTTALFLVGLLVIVFKITIPQYIALYMEFAVGVVLVALGVSVVKGYITGKVHAHAHQHEGVTHLHFHSHAGGEDHDHEHWSAHHGRSLLVGMVHGMAGSAALMLLVLATIPKPLWGLLYILVFGAGSILGMVCVSTAIGLPFLITVESHAPIHRWLRVGTGMASVAYGFFILTNVGFAQGLFRL